MKLSAIIMLSPCLARKDTALETLPSQRAEDVIDFISRTFFLHLLL